MNKFKNIGILCLMIVSTSSIAARSPLNVEARQTYAGLDILITGVSKKMVIYDIVVNNGYCHNILKLTLSETNRVLHSGKFNRNMKAGYPITVHPGQTRVAQVKGHNCQLQKVDVKTPDGVLTWTW